MIQTYGQSEFEFNGHRFALSIEQDIDSGKPWENEDGHGEVSEWTTRDKKPGEFVLCEDRRSKRFYDFAGAMKTARADGWGSEGGRVCKTAGEKAHRAVMADYKRLRDWCNDQWCYVGVIVTLLDADGDKTDISNSLWGIESDCDSYIREMAEELTADCLAQSQTLKALQ